MSIGILVGGSGEEYKKALNKHDHWIGVDRGALHLIKNGVSPHLSIGDFDSVSINELTTIKEHSKEWMHLPKEKADTDSEAAVLEAAKRYPNKDIYFYGGTGGRVDHLLQNIYMVLQPRFQTVIHRFTMKDNQNTIRFYQPGQYTILKEEDKQYFSVICLTNVEELNINHAKYKLEKTDVSFPRGYISNEFEEETANVSFKSGIVCVIQSRDEEK